MTTDPMRDQLYRAIMNGVKYAGNPEYNADAAVQTAVSNVLMVLADNEQAALSQPRIDAKEARELLEDGVLWVREMREGVNKWCDPFEYCGVHARLENLESWANHARALLAKLPAPREVDVEKVADNKTGNFLLLDQEFLDNWYAKVIDNRPDKNIYKEGLIAAYEDLSARVNPEGSRIDSTAVKIRMRNAINGGKSE